MPAGLDDVSDDRFLAELLARLQSAPSVVVFTTIQENMIAVAGRFLGCVGPVTFLPGQSSKQPLAAREGEDTLKYSLAGSTTHRSCELMVHPICCGALVRFWHKADKSSLFLFVRFWG